MSHLGMCSWSIAHIAVVYLITCQDGLDSLLINLSEFDGSVNLPTVRRFLGLVIEFLQ